MKPYKKTYIFFIIWIFAQYLAKGQNLVLNPSFEDTIHCPTGGNQVPNAQYWTNPTQGSPDYFNNCNTVSGSVSTPNNGFGTQTAHLGVAYSGFYTYNPVCREYIQGMLISPLIGNHKYLISFYVSLADYLELSSTTIGAFFSINPVTSTTTQIPSFIPQIQNKSSNPLTNKINWTLIQDTLFANGGEQYITIGNYMPDSLSDNLYVGPFTGWHDSYYYIDDVSVIDYGPMGVEDYNNLARLNVYPNPANEILNIELGTKQEEHEISIIDVLGNEVEKQKVKGKKEVIDISGIENGVYFVNIQNTNTRATKKIIIQH